MRKDMRESVKTLMDSREGRKFIWLLLEHLDTFQDPGSEYRQGRQSVGLELYRELMDPGHNVMFLSMHQEAYMRKELEKGSRIG